jgi:hypothetical protein
VTELEQHWPHRPSWDCLCCGKPWPCDPARESLAQEDGVSRSIYLTIQFGLAAEDMPTARPMTAPERVKAGHLGGSGFRTEITLRMCVGC